MAIVKELIEAVILSEVNTPSDPEAAVSKAKSACLKILKQYKATKITSYDDEMDNALSITAAFSDEKAGKKAESECAKAAKKYLPGTWVETDFNKGALEVTLYRGAE